MSNSRNHKDLIVWQKARRLAVNVYHTAGLLPRIDQFGLASQMRRAGVSVLSNISEGAARGTDKEFRHFLHVARGSLAELEAQLLVASDLGLVRADAAVHESVVEVGRLLNGLIAATQGSMPSG